MNGRAKPRLLALIAALLMALPCVAPAEGADGGYWSYLYVNTPNGNVLNLRAEPSADSLIIVGIPNGEQVAVLEEPYANLWVCCEYAGFTGYVASAYLSYDPPRLVTPRPTGKKPTAGSGLYAGFRPAYYIATVTPVKANGFVHMRYAPSTAQPVVRDYGNGVVLHVYCQNDRWSQVLDPDGHVMGYMMTEFLTYVEPLVFEEEGQPAATGDWAPMVTPAPQQLPAPTATPEPQTESNTNG